MNVRIFSLSLSQAIVIQHSWIGVRLLWPSIQCLKSEVQLPLLPNFFDQDSARIWQEKANCRKTRSRQCFKSLIKVSKEHQEAHLTTLKSLIKDRTLLSCLIKHEISQSHFRSCHSVSTNQNTGNISI